MAYGGTTSVPNAAQAAGRNTNSIVAGMIDRGPWFYYDTITVAAGTQLQASYQPFQVPIGQPNPLVTPSVPKTKLQTNMTKSGEFPPPRCLLLMSIQFNFGAAPVNGVYTPMLLDDILAVMYSSYMEFRIDDKIFHEGQLFEYPCAAGVAGATSQNGQAVWTNGYPAPQYGKRFDDWSKYIAPEQQFSMNIIFPGTPPTLDSNGPGWYGVVVLDGLTDRSVQ